MTKIKKGILGGLSGKIGPVVGANWKGSCYELIFYTIKCILMV